MDKTDKFIMDAYDDLVLKAPTPPVDAGVEDIYDYQEWLLLEACRIAEERLNAAS